MPRFTIELTDDAERDLAFYRAAERKSILESIVTQLSFEPTTETANRKRLRDNPLATWEVRIGKYRVFYEVEFKPDLDNDDTALVIIIAIGHKEHNVLSIRGKVVRL